MNRRLPFLAPLLTASWIVGTASVALGEAKPLERQPDAAPRNVVFILVDDQRWDAFSHKGHPFLKTPAADSIAENGVSFNRAYVTTSLCSPSRATILTGLYAHSHRVVDNRTPVSDDLTFFSEYLQGAGYETAFVGKWHMGDDDAPRRGWDHWVSFRGQGSYFPEQADGSIAQLNVDGERVPQTKYVTDELTDYAVRWLETRRDAERPWLLYLSHKAVHHDFSPAPRHRGAFDDVTLPEPPSTEGTELDERKPMWARNQRNSWHGANFPFHDTLGETGDIYRRYCEAMLSVDESAGRVLETLRELGLLESTLVIYYSDNGHLWGEQGLIDKRTAYEASIRVPLMMQCPEALPQGATVDRLVANVDLAPTILDAAGLVPQPGLHGRSLLPLARGERVDDWRIDLVYEYFWERWAPSTPTLHALVGERYKYVRPYGLWDLAELYDLEKDPDELVNLARDPRYRRLALKMDERLFERLAELDGGNIPLFRGWNGSAKELRHAKRSGWAPFPDELRTSP